MRRRLTIAWCLVAGVAAAAGQERPPSADEAAVRAVVAAYTDARDRNDPAAIGALFTADSDQFNTGGDWRRGRDAVVRGTLESSKRNPGARRIVIRGLRFPAPDVAIVDGGYEIGTGGGTRWTTLVLLRQGGTWKITAIRNAQPTNPPVDSR